MRRFPKETDHGWIEYLALVDRVAGRGADIRHQETAQHRSGPRRSSERIQGRNEKPRRGETTAGQRAGPAARLEDDRRRGQEGNLDEGLTRMRLHFRGA